MNKSKAISLFIALILLIFIGIMMYHGINKNINMSTASELATFGETQFLANDFQPYIDHLRQQGLNDLSVEVSMHYDFEDDYDKETKTLRLSCYINRITSDEIDNYFTTEYNGSNGKELATLMESIKNSYAVECKYTTDLGQTVVVSIDKPDYYVTIHTPSGRKYEYVFGFIDTVRVEIDGDWVFYADVAEILPEKPRGTHMPYIGMLESEIDTTCLGRPTTKEQCNFFSSLDALHRWTEYRWYDGDIQDREHLKCIVKISYCKVYNAHGSRIEMEVPGYVSDVVVYDGK